MSSAADQSFSRGGINRFAQYTESGKASTYRRMMEEKALDRTAFMQRRGMMRLIRLLLISVTFVAFITHPSTGLARDPLSRPPCDAIAAAYKSPEGFNREVITSLFGDPKTWSESDLAQVIHRLTGCKNGSIAGRHNIDERFGELANKLSSYWQAEYLVYRENIAAKLKSIIAAVNDIPQTDKGLMQLQGFEDDVNKYEHVEAFESEISAFHIAAEEPKSRIANAILERQCRPLLTKAKFPVQLQNEVVLSMLKETATLGRVYCLGMQSGAKMQFHTSTKNEVRFQVKTKSRDFTVYFSKRMLPDIREVWMATRVTTSADSQPLDELGSLKLMSMYPELVIDSTQ